MELKGLTIKSDGTILGTRVYGNDGEDLTSKLWIRGIQWQHRSGGIPHAVLTCSLAAIESIGVDAKLTEENIREISTLESEYREYEKVEIPSVK